MLEVLIGQFINVGDQRRTTIEHKPLRRLHEKMVTDVVSIKKGEHSHYKFI